MTNSNQAEVTAARDRIAAAFDPEFVRAAGHQLSDSIANHFQQVLARKGTVLNWQGPEENLAAAKAMLQSAPTGLPATDELQKRFREIMDTMLARGQNLHHPHYIGHQVPAPSPIAGLFDAVGSLTNQVMGVYEMGPWATSVENSLVQKLGSYIGWPAGSFAGMVTHGGSLANLTCLLTARNMVLPDCWQKGIPQEKKPVIISHADVHYGITRSAGILGLGTDNLVKAPLDELRRIDPVALEKRVTELQQSGHTIIAVVACSCATPIGAFDELDKLADICERHKIWFHVDAAHGGSALLSEKHRHLLTGIDRADSVAWDAHKMMFVPALCAFVFYKNAAHQFAAFQQDAPYLFDPSTPGMAIHDGGMKTLECTKRAAAYGLYGLWSMFGAELFRDFVDVTFETAQLLFQKIEAADDFEALHVPQCNILAFRYLPTELADTQSEAADHFQRKLRRTLIESGDFYIVQTTLNGQAALRCTVMNPLTMPHDLDNMLNAVRSTGQALLSS